MTRRPSLFSQEELTALLAELGERLARRGVQLSGYVVGGFAMTREVNARRLTEDLDGLFAEYAVARAEAEAMAREKGVSPSWFSDSASSFVEFDPADDLHEPERIVDIAFDVYGEDSMTLSDSRESLRYQAADLIRQAYPE